MGIVNTHIRVKLEVRDELVLLALSRDCAVWQVIDDFLVQVKDELDEIPECRVVAEEYGRHNSFRHPEKCTCFLYSLK
jgi:hypothetical protein